LAVAATAPVSAFGAFSDSFGISPVNVDLAGVQDAPALPGTGAFWAGTCDRAAAPAIGVQTDGGVGTRPSTIVVPTGNQFGAPQQSWPAPSAPQDCIDWGAVGNYGFGDASLWNLPPSWRLPPGTAAGGHPDASAVLWTNRCRDGGCGSIPDGTIDGTLDNIVVDIPPGFVGDPTALPKCTAERFALQSVGCPPETQVGILRLYLMAAPFGGGNYAGANEENLPVYNLEPRRGNVAELGIPYASGEDVTTVRLVAKARTNGDFGVTTFVSQIPVALPVIGSQITFWGVPWAASNDLWRPTYAAIRKSGQSCPACDGMHANIHISPGGVPPAHRATYDPSWGPIRPFLTNLSECDPVDPVTLLQVDSYERQGAFADGFPDLTDPDWKRYGSPAPAVHGCEKLPFEPSASFVPSASAADAPSGLSAEITIPQNDDPPAGVASDPGQPTNPDSSPGDLTDGAPGHWRSDAGRATAQLDKTVVPLPEGFTVNPAAAAGLEGCTDEQMGVRQDGNPKLFDNSEPTCPDGSKIGTAEATTPLLEEKLTGDVILGTPKSTDPTSGDMLRVFLVLRNEERGLLAKVFGSTVADPATGRLTATFDKNPRVPVENIKVQLKGGDRGVFAQAPTCGAKTTNAVFTPWTAAHDGGGVAKTASSTFEVGGDCSLAFAPLLDAGMSTAAARAGGAFSFKFERPQGQQTVRGLTAVLPRGLLASVRGVPLCSDAAAAAGNCPEGSRIGIVDAGAGSGTPFVLEEKGSVYLTEGYKGCPYGLMVKVRAIAGPFRGAMELSPIVVRQAVCVDRKDAQVTAVSDPLPVIHHGVPLRVRYVTVIVDRDKFMLNPSDCSTKQVGATLSSDRGASAGLADTFQASGCAKLDFRPKLALRLTGKRQVKTGKHPGIRAVVTQKGIPEAGIRKAEVRLPKSLALDVDNAQALCEFEDGTKPDLENHCPKGSIVGRSRAASPLLNRPLTGNVYFVKNVRKDPETGNTIRTLPMIVVALRGEIAINLVGESNVKKGKLVNTFDNVPDAPISKFNLNIKGGKSGIIAVTRTRRAAINLCAGRHVAEADMDGHNGRRFDRDVRMKTPCANGSKKTKAQRRKAAKRKAAAKKRAAKRRDTRG
jgi:hypothetical protein